jgi:hypothetical protein
LGAQAEGDAAQPAERAGKMPLAQRGSLFADTGFVPRAFELVDNVRDVSHI